MDGVYSLYQRKPRWEAGNSTMYGGFLKYCNGTPKSPIFNRDFHYKPSILGYHGYHYIWNHRSVWRCIPIEHEDFPTSCFLCRFQINQFHLVKHLQHTFPCVCWFSNNKITTSNMFFSTSGNLEQKHQHPWKLTKVTWKGNHFKRNTSLPVLAFFQQICVNFCRCTLTNYEI